MLDLLGLVVLVIFLGISLSAFFSVLGFFFDRRIERTKEIVETSLSRSFLVGLINFIFFASVALALFALANRLGGREILGLLGLLVLLPVAIGFVFGLAGMVKLVGTKFAPNLPVSWSRQFGARQYLPWVAFCPLWVGLDCFLL